MTHPSRLTCMKSPFPQFFGSMKIAVALLFTIVIALALGACRSQQPEAFNPILVFQSKDLVITQIAANTFIHTSYLQTNDFGNVPCNGMLVRNNHEVIIFDTPTSDAGSAVLIQWIRESLACTIIGVLPTHFHDDCLGGLQVFHDRAIPSYANYRTIELAAERQFTVPKNSFKDSLVLSLGEETIIARYFGEGHTVDNIVGYFPADQVLFGGCLIKEVNASKGYLGDANVAAWSGTVEKIRRTYPQVTQVVPGHGMHGGIKLLDYTMELFETEQ
jgi:metallo-beta-lactamase class B